MKYKVFQLFTPILVTPITLFISPLNARAEKVDATIWFSYGFGAGVSATLCDQIQAEMLTNLEARMFTSNFETSFEDEEVAEKYDIPAVIEGFNTVAKGVNNCNIRLD
mgnify:CR=1 FL=1